MNNIPKKLRAQMAEDPFYTRCCISGEASTPQDPIQWHHNLIYAGRQVQAAFAILPLKKSLHEALMGNKELGAQLDWVMLNRATPEQIQSYSKVIDYAAYLAALNCTFGTWVGGPIRVVEAGILY